MIFGFRLLGLGSGLVRMATLHRAVGRPRGPPGPDQVTPGPRLINVMSLRHQSVIPPFREVKSIENQRNTTLSKKGKHMVLNPLVRSAA